MASAIMKAAMERKFGKGTSKSAERRRQERERGTLHIGGLPGYEFSIGKTDYVVGKHGEFRRKVT
jgi:hypothetical protein